MTLLCVYDCINHRTRLLWRIVSSLDEIPGSVALLALLPEHHALRQVRPEILRILLQANGVQVSESTSDTCHGFADRCCQVMLATVSTSTSLLQCTDSTITLMMAS